MPSESVATGRTIKFLIPLLQSFAIIPPPSSVATFSALDIPARVKCNSLAFRAFKFLIPFLQSFPVIPPPSFVSTLSALDMAVGMKCDSLAFRALHFLIRGSITGFLAGSSESRLAYVNVAVGARQANTASD